MSQNYRISMAVRESEARHLANEFLRKFVEFPSIYWTLSFDDDQRQRRFILRARSLYIPRSIPKSVIESTERKCIEFTIELKSFQDRRIGIKDYVDHICKEAAGQVERRIQELIDQFAKEEGEP